MSKCARAQRGAQDRDAYFAKRFPSPAAQKENRKKHYGDRTGAAAKGREKGNSVALFSTPVMTWLGSEPIRHKYENRSPAPRRRGLRLARDGFLFHKKTIASPCFAAPPFTQKVTLGSPVRLQARSQRLAVATNLLRQVPLRTLAPIVKGMAAQSPFLPFRHSRLRRSCHLP